VTRFPLPEWLGVFVSRRSHLKLEISANLGNPQSSREGKRRQPSPLISEPPLIRHDTLSEVGRSPSSASKTTWEASKWLCRRHCAETAKIRCYQSEEQCASNPSAIIPNLQYAQPRRGIERNDIVYLSTGIDQSARSTTYVGRSAYVGGDVPIDEEQATSYRAVYNGRLSEADIQCLQL